MADSSEGPPKDRRFLSEEPEICISVSTSFAPFSDLLPSPPDIILASSDTVFFYVHVSQLRSASSNNFNDLTQTKRSVDEPPGQTVTSDIDVDANVAPVTDDSTVLNIILHSVYNISSMQYNPSIDTLVDAVDAMPKYGLSPQTHVSTFRPLFDVLLARAPIRPIDIYALAAAHDLPELATPVSAHLLSFPVYTLSDTLAARIGPLYVKRLFYLHLGRVQALKRLLVAPPHPHPPSEECDFTKQKKLSRAWALASAYLAWDARPGM